MNVTVILWKVFIETACTQGKTTQIHENPCSICDYILPKYPHKPQLLSYAYLSITMTTNTHQHDLASYGNARGFHSTSTTTNNHKHDSILASANARGLNSTTMTIDVNKNHKHIIMLENIIHQKTPSLRPMTFNMTLAHVFFSVTTVTARK